MSEVYSSLMEKLVQAIDAGTVFKLSKNQKSYNFERPAEMADFEFREEALGSGKGYFYYAGTSVPWDPRATVKMPTKARRPSGPSALSAQAGVAAYLGSRASGVANVNARAAALRAAKESYSGFVAALQMAQQEIPTLATCPLLTENDPRVIQAFEIFQTFEELDEFAEDPENNGASIGGAMVPYGQSGGGGWDELKRVAALLCSIPKEAFRSASDAIGAALQPVGDYLLTQLQNGNASRFFFTVLGSIPLYKVAMDMASPDSYITWGATALSSYAYSWVDPMTSLGFWWGLGGNMMYLGASLAGLGALGALTYVINATMRDIIKSSFWWAYDKLKTTGRYVAGSPAHIRAAMACALTIAMNYIVAKARVVGPKVGKALYNKGMTAGVKAYTWATMPSNKTTTTTSSSSGSGSGSGVGVRGSLQALAKQVLDGTMTPEEYETRVLAIFAANPNNAIQRAIQNGDTLTRKIITNIRNAQASELALRRPRAAILLVSKGRRVTRSVSGSTKRGAVSNSANNMGKEELGAEKTGQSAEAEANSMLEELSSGSSASASSSSLSNAIAPSLAALLEVSMKELNDIGEAALQQVNEEEALEESEYQAGTSSSSASVLVSGKPKAKVGLASNNDEEDDNDASALNENSNSNSNIGTGPDPKKKKGKNVGAGKGGYSKKGVTRKNRKNRKITRRRR